MRITISYASGIRQDGVVLSFDAETIRVALEDWEDATEFRYREGRWISEYGVLVHVDSLLVNSPEEWRVCGVPYGGAGLSVN